MARRTVGFASINYLLPVAFSIGPTSAVTVRETPSTRAGLLIWHYVASLGSLLIIFGPLLLGLATVAFGQYRDDSTLIGLPPFGSFHGSDFDSVLLQNGNLHVQIPILNLPMRNGKDYNWRYIYDTPGWQAEWFPDPKPYDPNYGTYRIVPLATIQFEDAGWRLTNPSRWLSTYTVSSVTCPSGPPPYPTYRAGYTLFDPDGTGHPFPLQVGGGAGPPGQFCGGQLLKAPSLDGSGIMWDVQTGIIYLKDGTQISQGTMTDSNGNPISPIGTNGITVADGPVVPLLTPLGATVNHSQNTTWTFKDSNGTSQTYQVTYGAFDTLTNMCHLVPHGSYACYEYSVPQVQPISLTLPTGKLYGFTWQNNAARELIGISLATGASVAYSYSDFKLAQPAPPGGGRANVSWNIRRDVATRTVNVGSQAYQWSYAYSPGGTTVTNPDLTSEVHTLGKVGVGTQTSSGPVETGVSYKDSNGSIVRTLQNDWTGEAGPYFVGNVRIIRVTTTLENGQASKVETDYDTPFPYTVPFAQTTPLLPSCTCYAVRKNLRERREFDFGAVLIRTTGFAYLHEANSTYVNLNIVDRPTSVLTYSGSSNTTPVAKTFYEYDVYTHPNQPMLASGAVQHSSTFDTNYTTRGNQTAVQQWRNTDGTLLTTTNQYDDAGNLLSKIDPMGNKTSFDFTDAWTNNSCPPSGQAKLHLTKITNAKGHITTQSYYSCSGLLGSRTDPNSQTTSYGYDLLGRPKLITPPAAGAQVSFCFSDDPNGSCYNSNTLQVTRTSQITLSLNRVQTTVFDGLGRVGQTQLNSDPDGITYTDTSYDSMGRVATVSNPYRSTSDPTYGVTTYQYDAVGRITQVLQPDNSPVSTSYTGNCTTVTDEAGKTRKSCSDGLGRLTQLFEAPTGLGALNYETDYQYDALDNLKQVDQKGNDSNSANWRTRTFTYNSLSQLLTASNPESGTITYTYYDDGMVNTKLAPKPNQTGSSTVTTTFSYDVLDRLTQKSYNDGTTVTVKFGYDGVAPTGCTPAPPALTDSNPKGYRNAMCDGSGATSWSHDALGRVLTEKRQINGASAKPVTYAYNLDGSAKTLTYPGTGKVITYTYSGAARALTAKDVGGAINYVTAATYAPQGDLSGMQNGASIFALFTYNSRFQPLQLFYTTGTVPPISNLQQTACPTTIGTILHRSYNFGAGTNNGNVLSITNCRDNNRTQNFAYDSLNRINQGYTTGTNWGEDFTIDAWGNLTNRSLHTGKINYELLNAAPANGKNQLPGFGYDAAGNMTSNGSTTYTYDAENRLTGTAGWTYVYDGDGKRVKKVNGSAGTLYWIGTGNDPIAENSLTGANLEEYIFFNGKRVARRDVTGSVVHYYFADHLGSADVVTSNVGVIQKESDYYPYGGEIVVTGSDANNYKFTGKERDAESGLDDFGSRYYASTMGRFMQADPSMLSAQLQNPQSWNRYSYTLNNPLRYVDPDGELWVAAQNGNGYNWQDTCNKNQTCYNSISTVQGNNLVVYGSNDAKDITTIQANDKGYVDLNQVAEQHDADFTVKDGAQSFLNLKTASDFFNVAEQYKDQNPGGDKLLVTDAGKADGSMFPPHKAHDLGRSVDVRYQDESGKNLQGNSAAGNAGLARTRNLVDAAKQNGFNQNYSSRPKDFGTKYAHGHQDHLHLGKIRPPNK